MHKHGFDPHVLSGAFTESSGVQAAQRALQSGQPLTAIFAGNDLSALGALDAIDEVGLKVPDDVTLLCVRFSGTPSQGPA